ncbi:hypothetical protein K7432_005399 [Basidiobolus ranarum]|uniref:CIP2A N-terminal domain-containing protein n=1 Tax=Basidiobolus ranarum TaxID=34480 RepID=A0ABR2WWI9_9FUNG
MERRKIPETITQFVQAAQCLDFHASNDYSELSVALQNLTVSLLSSNTLNQLHFLAKLSANPYAERNALVLYEFIDILIQIFEAEYTQSKVVSNIIVILTQLGNIPSLRQVIHQRKKGIIDIVSVRLQSTSNDKEWFLKYISLLKALTYEVEILYPTPESIRLIKFLRDVIKKATDKEVLGDTLALFSHLVRFNESIKDNIVATPHMSSFYRTLIQSLSSDDLSVIVYSLNILSDLIINDKLGEMLFNRNNISQTFKLIFNLITNGKSVEIVRPSVNLVGAITSSGTIKEYLDNYQYLEVCLRRVTALISSGRHQLVLPALDLLSIVVQRKISTETVFRIMHDCGVFSACLQWVQCRIREIKRGNYLEDIEWPYLIDDICTFFRDVLKAEFTSHSKSAIKDTSRAGVSIDHDDLELVITSVLDSIADVFMDGYSFLEHDLFVYIQISPMFELVNYLAEINLLQRHLADRLDIQKLLQTVRVCLPEKNTNLLTPKEETTIFFLWLVVKYYEYQQTVGTSHEGRNAMANLVDLEVVADLIAVVISCSTQNTIVKCAFEILGALSCQQQVQQRLCRINENRCLMTSANDSSMGVPKVTPFLGTRTSFTQTHISEDDIKARLESELNSAKIEMRKELLAQDEHFEEVKQDYEEQLEAFQSETKHLRELLEARTLALNQTESLITELRGTHTRIEQDITSYKDKALEFETNYNRLKFDFDKKIEDNERLRSELKSMKEEIAIAYTERENLQCSLVTCQGDYENQKQEMDRVQQEYSTVTSKMKELEDSLQTMKEQNRQLEEENSINMSKILEDKYKYESLTDENITLQSKYSKERERYESIKQQYDVYKDEHMEQNLTLLRNQKEIEDKYDCVLDELNRHKNELEKANSVIQELEEELEKHEHIASMMMNMYNGKRSDNGASISTNSSTNSRRKSRLSNE